MNPRILIIEDDPEIAGLVDFHLKDQGFETERAGDGETGLARAMSGEAGLIVLDLMIPGLDGLQLCRTLRESGSRVPILMLTARSEEIDKVLGLELGADDYLTKPFSVRELIARVKAILRRAGPAPHDTPSHDDGAQEPLTYGDLTVHLAKRRVTLNHKAVDLTAKEFDLLAAFATNPGKPYTREQLLNQVWGYSYTGYEHTVNSHINRLRAKIETDPSNPRFILTVWGYGYRFVEMEEAVP